MESYRRLEIEFGRWAGVDNVVACSSGTAALHLALEAMQFPVPPYGVFVPDFTMVACARAVTLAGLKPMFVDCDDDLLMDLSKVTMDDALYARAIMPVHIYGRRCSMDNVRLMANLYGLRVIEDCAECPVPYGKNEYKPDAACFSFYKNKVIAGEEGGAVAFANPEHAARARQLRCLGFTDKHDFQHVPRGHNYRLANSLASLVLDSLGRVEENLAERRRIESWYDALCPAEWKMPPRDVPWVYDLRIPEGRDRVVEELNKAGIAARHGFKCLSLQVEYIGGPIGPNADKASREMLYLPIQPMVTSKEDVRKAFGVMRRVLEL